MLGFDDIQSAAQDVMAKQHDPASLVRYWEEQGVMFDALDTMTAGFAQQSVANIGRAARKPESVAAVIQTAMKVGLAIGWELRGRTSGRISPDA